MPIVSFTAKEIHIIVQLLLLMMEEGAAFDYAKPSELRMLREKLQNVKGV